MRKTIRDIAKELNLSHTTVSRVLNNRTDFISERTRQRVLKAIKTAGYQPNLAARALVTGRTNLIAFWSRYLHTPFQVRVVQALFTQLKADNYELLIRSVPEDTDSELSPPRLEFPTDGVIAFETAYPLLWRTHETTPYPPVVSLGAYYCEKTDHVGIDLFYGASLALNHLYEAGCRRIAYLLDQASNRPGDARLEAYLTFCRESGLQAEQIVAPLQTRSSARETLKHYIETWGAPTGLFCINDEMAIGAYRALLDLKLNVPDDVALVGCDGIEDTEYLERPLSTIVQPIEEMCLIGWQFLRNRIQNPDSPPQQLVLRPQLVVRESSVRR
ncbi:MAG TPA: LacI family DNA-binding transcriptional regulator [Chthonomonas sp.]|uniref:LacI family DNA-binding transcriptional regulator n=1 Tax=Chthonomonas sp. TaxID=2282153 RepID=UPI002B4AB118|nr:LacI family DNA-binding transcriptional regulator [Chthonomonas sp.]HLH78859.1 LacI family DNA-binding transcriptional regulator [Chthonomonas sp.]